MATSTKIPLFEVLKSLTNAERLPGAKEEGYTGIKFHLFEETDLDGDHSDQPDLEFNFVFRTHDGQLIITKNKFTLEGFDRLAEEMNIDEYEPVEFTGSPIN